MARIDVQMNFTANKTGLNEILTMLKQIEAEASKASLSGTLNQDLKQASETAKQLENILNSSFNSKIGQLDLSKLNNSIKDTYGSVDQLRKKLESVGQGRVFNKLSSDILNTHMQLKESNKVLDEMASTMANTVKWGVTSSIFDRISNSIQRAYEYVKELDTSLNDIRIVTGYSAEQMESFAQSANRAASALGASTRDYTEASLIYYQQGLDDAEVQARTETTLKAANVTGQTGDEVSEQLTAIWNGYKVTADETELYIDKVAKVAAATAADLEELSTGMSKVASAANSAGVDIDQLNATLATVISVTREAPETVGTAFRSIYARLGDLALDGEDEFGVSLGTVSGQMEELGIQILDEQGQMRDMGDIIEDTAEKWQTWTQAQRQAAAVAMAGKQQYSRLIALFDNWDMYTDALNESQNAMGTLNEQQNIYMDSIEAHLQKLSTEAERTYDILFDTNAVNAMSDAMTGLLSIFNTWMEGVGGGLRSIAVLGANVANIFSKQIGSGIAGMVQNRERQKANEDSAVLKQNIIDNYQAQGRGDITEDSYSAGLDKEVEIASKLLNIKEQISSEEYNYLTSLQKESGIAAQKLANAESYKKELKEIGFSEENSLEFLEKQNKVDVNQLEAIKKQRTELEDIQYLMADIEKSSQEKNDIAFDSAFDEIGEYENTLTEAMTLQKLPSEDLENEFYLKILGTEQERIEANQWLNNLIQGQNNLIADQQNRVGTLSNAIKNKTFYESEGYKNLQLEQQARDRLIQQAQQQAEKQKAITASVEGITTLISLLTTASGIFSTIADEDLTVWEKFGQITTTLLMTLPLLITNFNSLKTLLPNIAISLGATTLAEDATAASALKATVSIMGMKMALWEFFLIIGVVVAAIVGIVAAVKAVSDAYNAEAIEAQKAAEAAKELEESNKAVQESYQNLQSAFDAYDTAIDKLDQCIQGTEEWKQALEEVNSAAVEAIEAIPDGMDPELIKDLYSRDEKTGQIILDENKMEDIETATGLNAAASQFASTMGNYDATIKSNSSQMLNTTRDLSESSVNAVDAISFLTAGFSGLAIANEAEAQIIQDKVLSNLEDFSEAMTVDEFREKLQKLGMNVSSLTDNELENYKNKVIELANSTESATERMKLLAGLQIDKVLGDNFDASIKDIVTNQATQQQTEIAQEITDKLTGQGISASSNSGNDIYKEIAQRLSEATNGQYRATTGNTVLGSDSNRRLIFEDASGEKTEEKSVAWIANTIAAYEALEKAGGNAEKAQSAFEGLEEELGEGISDSLKDFITNGNLETLTQDDYQKLLGYSKKDLMKAMNITDSKEFDKMFGEKGYDGFKKSLEDYGTALNTFTDNMVSSARETFENINDTDDLTLAGKKSIAEALENALVYSGEETMSSMSDMFNRMDAINLRKFTDVTSEISNWGDVTLTSFKQSLEDAGVVTNLTDEELKEYIRTMQEATGATKDFNSLSKTYADIHSIIDELETGDTISSEDYQKLGEGASEYFTKMLDGTYKLTTDAQSFYDMIQNQQIIDFQNSLNDQREQLNRIQGLSQIDYSQEALDELGKSQYKKGSWFSGTNATIDTQDLETQLQFISALSENQVEVERLIDKQKNNSLEEEDYEKIAEEVRNCTDAYRNLDDTIETVNSNIYENELALLSSVDNLADLKDLAQSSEIEEDSAAYQQAELNLHEAEKWEDLDTDEIEDYADHLREIADSSDDLADSLENDKEASRELSRQIIRMNEGIDELADGWEDWSDILKNSSRSSEEYAEALSNTREALADILDTSKDYISEDFVKEHMDEIGEAAKGNVEAIDELHNALAKQIVLDIAVDNGLDTQTQNDLLNQINILQSQLPDLEVGASIDGTQLDQDYADFQNTLASLVEQSGMTADQVNAFLGQMGYEADFETEPQTITQNVPVTVSETEMTGVFPPKFVTRSYQSGTEPITQTVEVPRITAASNGKKALKINKISRKAPSSYSNYSPKNSGGKSPGSGSGGGGSKGSEPKEPDKQEQIEGDKDRYHDVNIELEQIQTNLDRLEKQQDKLFGQDLIDNLNKQLKELNNQIDTTNEKLVIARGELSELRAELAQKGVSFNEDGTIANYSAAYDAQLNYANGIINKYNSMSAEAQETYKETVDKAKEDFDKFVENIERYDELVSNEIPGLEDDIQDAIDKQIEIQIEKFNMEIEIRLDLAEAERDWNEFKKNVIDQIDEDDILGNAEARLEDFFSYYKDDGTGIVQRNTVHIEDILTQLKQMDDTGWSDVYGDNRAQALEDLQTYYEQMMEDLQDLEELQDEIHESYLDMIDEAQDKFDEQIDTFEQITSLIEHDMDLIELVNGEESYSELANYYEKLEDNYNKQLDFQRQQVEFWKQQMDLAEQGSEEWEAARDNWMDAVEDWRSTVEDAVENATDKYVNAINEIFQNLNDKVTNGMGLDYVEEEWNLINENADQYLDTINSMYGIQDLENKYLDAIDQTDNISAQQKLNDLMQEELAALQEKDKLTQYDIDRANMKYEIALKQIALEEAQQNKSQLRLRRDSQGNYSYQFVSDESEIGQLRDELNELYNQLYNFDLEHYRDNLDQIYSVWAEYQEKMAEAAQINDPEERAQREALLQEQYGELINGLVEQNETIRLNLHESAFTELAELYDIDLENFKQLSEDQKDILLGDMIPQWTSGVQDMADVFAGEDGFANVCKDAMEDLKEATEDYEQSLEDIESTAGISFDTILDGTDNIIDQTEDLLWENDELINSYEDQLDAIRDIINELSSLIAKYNAAREAAITATEAAYKYWQEQQRQAAAEAAKENANSGASSNSGSSSNSGGSGGGKGSGGGDGVLNVGDTVTYTGGTYYYDSYGTSPAGNRGPGKKVTVTQVKEDGRPYPIHVQSNNSAYGWLKRSQLSGYDTGGYTGDWGDNSGKLALLHKKELVLNRNDTSNLLQGIQILRNIVDSVGSSMMSRMANLTSNIGINSNVPTNSDTLEQNVHIEANFPNVESSKEIEDALNNLVNVASQRVYRRR